MLLFWTISKKCGAKPGKQAACGTCLPTRGNQCRVKLAAAFLCWLRMWKRGPPTARDAVETAEISHRVYVKNAIGIKFGQSREHDIQTGQIVFIKRDQDVDFFPCGHHVLSPLCFFLCHRMNPTKDSSTKRISQITDIRNAGEETSWALMPITEKVRMDGNIPASVPPI